MTNISINTPALLFPAISLILLAYTNRFLGLSSVVRQLHQNLLLNKDDQKLQNQIKNLHYRIKLIRRMQFFGIISILLSIICMFLIYIDLINFANYVFGLSLLSFSISLIFSLIEITQSTKALEIMLKDL
jgi:hypothetical protein